MKIIQYFPYSYHIHSWGLEKIAQTLSDWLNKENDIKLVNITSDIKKWWKINDSFSFSDTIFIPSFDLISWFPVPKIWSIWFKKNIKFIRQYKPDIIITHTRFFLQSMIGGLIAKRLWCKRIHIEHGSGFVSGYPRYVKSCAWLFDWTIGLRIFRQCDQIITISKMHKNFISKFTQKKPKIIYNPIDYSPKNKIKNKKLHIWFIGRLVPLKWVHLLIQALKDLEDYEWECTIVGTGSEDDKLKQLVCDLRLKHRILFRWSDDRTNRLYKFDILVNPSYQEGLPTTVVEALIAKCIVVATDVGGTKEISNKDDLILVKSGDIVDLKKWILLAITNRQDNSGDSYDIVVNKFNSIKVLKEYITFIHNI